MNRKQFLLALVFVAVFSFLGGIVGGAISGGGIIMAAKDLLDDSTFSKPKKINHLKSEYIEADIIITKGVNLQNESGDIIGTFAADVSGNPSFELYSKEKPFHKPHSKEKPLKDFIKDFNPNPKPAFSISISNNAEPMMHFFDKDLDSRISIGVFLLEPLMIMLYRDKLRLSLGTNRVVEKTTGNVTTMKGSICTFDNKGNVTSQIP